MADRLGTAAHREALRTLGEASVALRGVPVVHVEVGVDHVRDLAAHEVQPHLEVVGHEVLLRARVRG